MAPSRAASTATIYRSTTRELTDSLRRFLATQPYATLATHDADGSVHLVPTWYLFEDERIYIATWSRSRKARNVAARPQVTVTIDDRDAAAWVSATGRADVLDGQVATQLNRRLRRRYLTEAGLEVIGPVLEQAEDATIAITPERWRAWDYESTLLAALEATGIPTDDADAWYRA